MGLWPQVSIGTLGLVDVRIGTRVIVERKTVHDLVRSNADDRLFRQLYALYGECSRPLLCGVASNPGLPIPTPAIRQILA